MKIIKNTVGSLLIMAMLLTVCSAVSAQRANISHNNLWQEGKNVRVGILTKQVNVLVSVDGDYELQDDLTGAPLASFAANNKAIISSADGAITVNGSKMAAATVRVAVKPDKVQHYIEVNRRHYRGGITIQRTVNGSGLTVINTIGVEEYLYGVIAREISPDWPLEAVKAQAVAARTYLLANMNKHKQQGFDICATTDCQVYGGYDSEKERSRKAVDDTAGQAILYKGKLIPAYFHSSSGGYTEDSENVWGTYQPYLRGVVDFDQNSPHFKWEKEITPKQLETALRNAGYNIGSLEAIYLSRLTPTPVSTQDRGVSGRVKTLQFVGSNSSVAVSGAKLRTLLSLNSTLFDIDIIVSVKKKLEFGITDSAGDREKKHVELNLPPRKEQGLVTDSDDIRRISGRADEKLLITGYGWGHGVGLSQWGAKAMAEKVQPSDTTYYKTILKHYYQGVDIEKVY